MLLSVRKFYVSAPVSGEFKKVGDDDDGGGGGGGGDGRRGNNGKKKRTMKDWAMYAVAARYASSLYESLIWSESTTVVSQLTSS